MRSFLNRKVKLAFGFAMLTLLFLGSFSYRWMVISHEVIENIQDLALALGSVRSGSRGFALTGQESDLATYRADASRAAQDLAAIRNQTADNPNQQRHFPDIEILAAERIQYADMIVSLRRTQGLAAAVAAMEGGRDQETTDEFQALAGKMQDEELRLLALRDAETERDRNQTRTILIIGTLLGILVAGLAAWSALPTGLFCPVNCAPQHSVPAPAASATEQMARVDRSSLE